MNSQLSKTTLSIRLGLTVLIVAGLGQTSMANDTMPNDKIDQRPNVVFILADDLGWRDLSNEGSTFYESPNIDQIANHGVKFTRGYATCQVCSPSRASIMTGQYPARLDITDWIGAGMGTGWKRNTKLLPATYNRQLPQKNITIAESFRDAGYRTMFAGKWHLGGQGSFPEDHGFEFNFGGHHRGSPPGGYFSPYQNPKLADGDVGEHLPIRLGQETANFIRDHKDEPFFAFLSFYSVHGPIQTTEKLWKKYRAKANTQKSPENRFIIDRTLPVRQVQDNPLYAGMVESMDDAVGLVLTALKESGVDKSTIIVFTSDNGGVSAGDGKATSNLPLRGGKGRQWEGGIREPFYIFSPLAKNNGQQCATPVIGTDFYPTLLELANIDARPDQHIDGVSLVPLLNGESIPNRDLFWHYPHYGNQGGEPSSIIRRGDWKMIHYYEDNRRELYNIKSDIGEQKNVAEENPDRVIEMGQQLSAWLAHVDGRMPETNPNYDARKAAASQRNMSERVMPNLEKQHARFLEDEFRPSNGWLWQK